MKYSPIPASRAYTLFIAVLLIGLIGFGIAAGNPYAYIIAGVLLVFLGLPILLIYVMSRAQRRKQNPLHNGHDVTLDETLPVGADEPEGDG